MLLLIDNFDSFTHNLARYFVELGQDVKVVRNNAINIDEIKALAPDYLVISPGPCTPSEAGLSLQAIEVFAGQIPILGVCLGHQAIGQVFGTRVTRAKQVMHGKTSAISHQGLGLLADVPSPVEVTRYHSLILEPATLPSDFLVDAWSDDQEIMAIRHKQLPLWGLQFHPESVLTQYGHKMLDNFLRLGARTKISKYTAVAAKV